MSKKSVRWIHDGVDYEIRKSDKPEKKLMAIYTENGKKKKLYFGSSSHEHFYDKTELLDKKLNHMDKDRRRLYRARHKPITQFDKPSPSLLSWSLLW